jgi:hypothetical protein
MTRVLWLTNDAVAFPARLEHIELALDFLEAVPEIRLAAVADLRRSRDQQQSIPPEEREAVPCLRPEGLYTLLPWRLAAWLEQALAADAETIGRLRNHLVQWLANEALVPR